jgi:hypothetical protein
MGDDQCSDLKFEKHDHPNITDPLQVDMDSPSILATHQVARDYGFNTGHMV